MRVRDPHYIGKSCEDTAYSRGYQPHPPWACLHIGRAGEVLAPDSGLSLAFTLLSWESYHNLPPSYTPSKGGRKEATSPEQ